MFSDTSKDKLLRLVELFRTNIDQYKSQCYDEANTRTDFVDKFFELLGWDVRNTAGRSEKHRDVVREYRVRIHEHLKAPDYSFQIGGYPVFFVEAKKPSANIKDNVYAAHQLRRYGYTAKLPFSILTNFREFAVYNTKIKLDEKDKAQVARIFYCTFDQLFDKCIFPGYETNFDYLFGIFAKESVLAGNFDRYAATDAIKRGTSEVDEEILALIEEWRLTLARNIAKSNPLLDLQCLNVAVQRIVDRIVFLRIAEDRQIERYENLLKATNEPGIYGRLQTLFADADEKYNAGLFLREDWLGKLIVDDKILTTIITGLYYPKSQYAFSVLPIEILGSIYERFLGKTIRLTAGHQAKVEEKTEVRKAGGVYYTPQYIVDYIVRETVGRSCCRSETGNPPTLTILDPACGSGSFLIGAYTFLLDTHLAHYTNENNLKKSLQKKLIYGVKGKENTYRLSIEEKQRILINGIHGVDIDPIAVEVAKLSLYLKLLEHETQETAEMLFRHSDLRLLPNLDKNILCGNSLIESDFYRNKNLLFFDDDEMRKVNVFDWPKAFPAIFKKGGFDCVIGNPPYVRIQLLNQSSPHNVEYFNTKYRECIAKSYDIYVIFIYRGFQLLNSTGRQGMILPNKFFQAEMGEKIRKYLASQNAVSKIVDFSANQVFSNATTYTCLLFLDKNKPNTWKYKRYNLGENITLLEELDENAFEMKNSNILDAEKWTFIKSSAGGILSKIFKQPDQFTEITEKIFKGSSTGNDGVFLLDLLKQGKKTSIFYSTVTEDKETLENDLFVPFLYGENVRRYSISETTKYLLFPYRLGVNRMELILKDEIQQKFPRIFDYLFRCKKLLLKRKIKLTSKDFYRYSAARSLNNYDKPKIMIPDMLVSLRVGYDSEGVFYHGPAIHSVVFKPLPKGIHEKFYLAILNSKVFWFFISNTSTALRGNAYRLTPEYINPFCFPSPLDKNGMIDKRYDRLIDLVDQMSAVQVMLHNLPTELNCERVRILDDQINELVYELYGLTDREIKIVEKEG